MDWIPDEIFNKWLKEREKERERTFEDSWAPKERGTTTSHKVYEIRFLPDPEGIMYKKFFYHMYQGIDGAWIYVMCPKTNDFKNFCPLCYLSSKLYSGSQADKAVGKNYRRKSKFVGNVYVVSDPRDNNEQDEAYSGKVYVYDFPGKIESKIDVELKDKEGLGKRVFDPGPDGYNFLIKVKSTSDGPDSFPDYSDSCFARKPSPLGTNKEIEKIMSQRFSINNWISQKFSENDWSRVKDSLEEADLFFDSLRREWNKHFKDEDERDEISEVSYDESKSDDESVEDPKEIEFLNMLDKF